MLAKGEILGDLNFNQLRYHSVVSESGKVNILKPNESCKRWNNLDT